MEISYIMCLNCGKLTFQRVFCLYCHSPLLGVFSPPKAGEGLHLANTERGEFRLPLRYFGYHFAFYGVTGTGKTRAAMNLAIKAENAGLCLRILDVEGEWKKIIPRLSKDTLYYASGDNLRLNPFDLKDRSRGGLYQIALSRLRELERSKSGIIRFPKVFEKLRSSFSITKEECWELLFMFRDLGFIEIVPYQGIRILRI